MLFRNGEGKTDVLNNSDSDLKFVEEREEKKKLLEFIISNKSFLFPSTSCPLPQ